jgi:hypothetical protein
MIFFFLLGQITTGVNISEGRREKKKRNVQTYRTKCE